VPTAAGAERAAACGRPECLEVRIAPAGGLDRLETPGSVQQQPGGFGVATHVQRDLAAKPLQRGAITVAQRSACGVSEQGRRRVGQAREPLQARRGEATLGAAVGVRGQLGGPLKERRGSCQAATRLSTSG
jgi:hypothetical protein